MNEDTVTTIQWGVVIGASLTAAVIDVKSRRIPNRLTGPLFLFGLIWSGWLGGISGFGEGFLAALLLAMPFMFLFIFAGGGAGDAKLTGAIGAWLVLREAAVALACICIAGGILGLVIALYKKRLKAVLANMVYPVYNILLSLMCRIGVSDAVKSVKSIQGERLTIPYGVAIFAGVCVAAAIIWTGWTI
jgi:prepilin peptidase CpaA